MNFCRAALCKRGLSRHAVSVVHPPVTFVDSVETNKHIFQKNFYTGILVLTYQTSWQYSDGTPPPNGASNAGMGYAEIAILSQHLASSHAVNTATGWCYQHGDAGPWQVETLIAGSKRRSLVFA